MSVRVNLLPQEQVARQAAARQRNGLIATGLLVLLILALVTMWQNGRIAAIEERLADEQAVLLSLQAEINQLDEFSELEQRIADSETLIAAALGNETSLAGILQDIASVIPSDAELDSLTLNVDPTVPVPGTESRTIGTMVLSGRSASNHAPGLERLLLEFDKVAAFRELFFTSSTLDDPDEPYISFNLEIGLGEEIRTGRYSDGVPEALR
ncbi:MAG: hypothetical protein WEB09_00145 [Nitriliruptor sp.]